MEFQCKEISMQQTLTVIDAIYVSGVLHVITNGITRIVRVRKRMRDQRVLRDAQQTLLQATVVT